MPPESDALAPPNMASGQQGNVGQTTNVEDNPCAEMIENDDNHQNLQSDSESEDADESEQEETDESVIDDMRKLERNFKGIYDRYRLIRRIGEGTFSTVYKAEDLLYDNYYNDYWDFDEDEEADADADSAPYKRRRVGDPEDSSASIRRVKKKKHYVALKKIYVTSSPLRIQNELELLLDLRGCPEVCPIITAFRQQDQVVAVLPYFPHADFRNLYRTFLVEDMRLYLESLLIALEWVHKQEIIHRDIKPTNFLYNPVQRRGVLVDFGLAERVWDGGERCYCSHTMYQVLDKPRVSKSQSISVGFVKNDSRPARRANRAGTRGFRAPEVLFKCSQQTTKIDIWSVGVILLTLLGRRFPFFHSVDDVDAIIELASIFGYRRMRACAAHHGQVFETTIPTIGEKGFTWEKIVQWSSCVSDLTGREKQATKLLYHLLDLNPDSRVTAVEALSHEFFTKPEGDDLPWEEVEPDEEEKSSEKEDKGAVEQEAEATAAEGVAEEVQFV